MSEGFIHELNPEFFEATVGVYEAHSYPGYALNIPQMLEVKLRFPRPA